MGQMCHGRKEAQAHVVRRYVGKEEFVTVFIVGPDGTQYNAAGTGNLNLGLPFDRIGPEGQWPPWTDRAAGHTHASIKCDDTGFID